MNTSETVLAQLTGERDCERLLVVLQHGRGEGSRIELQQQSWGEGVGWFTQSSVQLDPQQLAQLRGVIGAAAGRSTPAAATQRAASSFVPRVVHAESA